MNAVNLLDSQAIGLNTKMSEVEKRRVEKETGDFNLSIDRPRNPKDPMGKDEFLKLLIAQMENQDPLEPLKSHESIAQMAQFSALEQMHNVAGSMESLSQGYARLESGSFIGKQLTYFSDVTETIESGVATEVKYEEDGAVKIMVGDEEVMFDHIKSVSDPMRTAAARAYDQQLKTTITGNPQNKIDINE